MNIPDISIVHNTTAVTFKTIGYYVCETGLYDEPDSPIGFRSTKSIVLI